MKRILIIEDEPAMRAVLEDVLQSQGFQTLSAADGSRGVALTKQELPDLILCDVMMPEMTGHGVLTALRNDPATARIPFIFLTAMCERADVRNGMNQGADDYLMKPVHAEELRASIEARLARAGQHAGFFPNFNSAVPLEKLGLTTRESEILLWVAQGKANSEVGTILRISAATVKKHLENIYKKLGVESRNAATWLALEAIS